MRYLLTDEEAEIFKANNCQKCSKQGVCIAEKRLHEGAKIFGRNREFAKTAKIVGISFIADLAYVPEKCKSFSTEKVNIECHDCGKLSSTYRIEEAGMRIIVTCISCGSQAVTVIINPLIKAVKKALNP
jgi:hypothetical protein